MNGNNNGMAKHRHGTVRFRVVKPEIRVLGVDDGVFVPHSDDMVDVVGVVYRGGYWLDGFMHTTVQVDGTEATEKLAAMITQSPHHAQLRVIMINGVTLAGFNVVDIEQLYRKVQLPVIAVTRDKPNFDDIRNALRKLPDTEKRWKAIQSAGKLIEVRTRDGEEPIFAHVAGISKQDAKRVLKNTSTRSNIPEALRVAHIIASGLSQSRKVKPKQ